MHHAIALYETVLANVVTYALVGLIVEALRMHTASQANGSHTT
jgi:hypothetical protein